MLGTEGGSIGTKAKLTRRTALTSLVVCMELGRRGGKRSEVQWCSIAGGWRATVDSRGLGRLVNRPEEYLLEGFMVGIVFDMPCTPLRASCGITSQHIGKNRFMCNSPRAGKPIQRD
jgi:hypothetical protein